MASSRIVSRGYNLVVLSIVAAWLPILTLLLWFNYAAVVLADRGLRLSARRRKLQGNRTVLITGTATVNGLDVARAFYKDGYRVVGADLASPKLSNIAKHSRAISKHYDLPQPSAAQGPEYMARCILIIAKKEQVDFWVDCSQELPLNTITNTRRELQDNGICPSLAMDLDSSHLLENRETFLDFLHHKGLPTPEVHRVTSRAEIHNVLNSSQGRKKYLLTSPLKTQSRSSRTLLPQRTVSQTYHNVSLVKITQGSHMILEEYCDPSTVYECFAVVVRGSVTLFSATCKTGSRERYGSHESALWRAMRSYTDAVARGLGSDFSSHLILRFGVNEKVMQAGIELSLLPLEATHRLNSMSAFPTSQGSTNLVEAYSAILHSSANGCLGSTQHKHATNSPPRKDTWPRPRYFVLDDIATLLLEPCIKLVQRRTSLSQVLIDVGSLLRRVLFWNEAYYDIWDPMPALWEYSFVRARTTLQQRSK